MLKISRFIYILFIIFLIKLNKEAIFPKKPGEWKIKVNAKKERFIMNILSIGNSFSEDAQRYLHEVAVADGFDLDTYNIVLGGCSLSMHYENMTGKANPYCFHKNSKGIKNEATLDDALLSGNYDVITIQQVSHLANKYDTYQPYLNEVIAYVRKFAPNAKIALHQTWAYEQDSDRLKLVAKYENHTDMFNDIKLAYDKAAKEINADFIIPSGELFQNLLKSGISKILFYRKTSPYRTLHSFRLA